MVKKAKKGDKEALLQLIMAEKDAYYKLALTYLGNEHDAMDAMEEMIVKLYENIHQLKKNESFYSWSKTILVNGCKALLSNQNNLTSLDEWKMASGENVTSNPYGQCDNKIDIQSLLLNINAVQREAIQLKFFHDFDYKSIASITNVSVGTVKSRIFHGLKKLREHYGGDIVE